MLTPLGHAVAAVVRGTGAALAWLGRYLLVVPVLAVHRWVLVPLGRGLAVVARETADAVVIAWKTAGRVTRSVFGFLGRVLRFVGRVLRALLVTPFVWVWQQLVAPVGRAVRDHLWRPFASGLRAAGRSVRAALSSARASVRATRAEIRRACLSAFGAPRTQERERLPEGRRVP